MPLIIKGKSYPLAGEKGQQGLTGREIIEIENQFGLDGVVLLGSLADEKAPAGYTKAKAIYALAWVAMTRAGEVVSLADILNDYALDELEFNQDEDIPKEVTEG